MHVAVTITHLAEPVETFSVDLSAGRADLRWTPPAIAPRGYGLTVQLLDGGRNRSGDGVHRF